MSKLGVDMTITVSICGRTEPCRILRVYPLGTVDVERISDGQCFRVTGLWPGSVVK